MIENTTGSIFDCGTEAVVNPVNTAGVMGKGLALQFKRRFPANFDAYRAVCKSQALQLGRVFTFDRGTAQSPRYVVNFPTKRHWRSKSTLHDIESGLHALLCDIRELEIASVALPALGCGLGGLPWSEVEPTITEVLGPLTDVRVLLFAPRTPA